MNRMFGMMPRNEIEIEKTYKDKRDLKITVQSGKNGWTVLWADHSSTYKDEVDSAESNFEKAYAIIKEHMPA